MINQQRLQELKKTALIFDIETWAEDANGEPIDIRRNPDEYVHSAKVRWLGMYSMKYNKYQAVEMSKADIPKLIKFINEHDCLVGFNNLQFDTPIMMNNHLLPEKFMHQLDCMVILGTDKYRGHKNRSAQMGVSFKGNSLRAMAEAFGCDTQKGDIDYEVFRKTEYSDEERQQILSYLKSDVMATKEIFEKLFNFWAVFANWVTDADVENWSWLTSSIASLTYKAACKIKGVEPTYGEKEDGHEEMGGRAITPSRIEAYGVWYLDEKSKYPHTFSQFDLFNEVNPEYVSNDDIESGKFWHGNDTFKVKGYYDMRQRSALSRDIIVKLKTRWAIQDVLKQYKKNPEQPVRLNKYVRDVLNLPNNIDSVLSSEQVNMLDNLQVAIKIFLNALYGAVRSPIFEQIHTPNAGWDCCWLGQQIHEQVQWFFEEEKGRKAIGGFTDSWFIEGKEGDTHELISEWNDEIVTRLKAAMPYPEDTYKIGIECFMDYILFVYDNKKIKGEPKGFLKNNYVYVTDDWQKVEPIGIPVKKVTATPIGRHIFYEHIVPKIKLEKRGRFDKEWVEELIDEHLTIEQMAQVYQCKPEGDYKTNKDGTPSNNIYAQISRNYTDGLGGTVQLIKNKKVGRCGKSWKYGSLEECQQAGVTNKDLDLSKVRAELYPFTDENDYKGDEK